MFDDRGKPIKGSNEKAIANEPCNADMTETQNAHSGDV